MPHSPSPWLVNDNGPQSGNVVRAELHVGPKAFHFADILDPDLDELNKLPKGQFESNIRLMMAAPALLAACKRMERASENHGSRKQMMNAAMIAIRAAVAQAEG